MKNRYKNHARKKRAKRWKIIKKVIQKDPLGPNMASKITQWRQNDRGSHPGGRILCGPADESCFRYRQSLARLHFEWFWEGVFGVSSLTLSVFCCTSFCRAHPILWIDFLKMLGSLLLESVAGLLLYSVRRAQSMLVYASFGNISMLSAKGYWKKLASVWSCIVNRCW